MICPWPELTIIGEKNSLFRAYDNYFRITENIYNRVDYFYSLHANHFELVEHRLGHVLGRGNSTESIP